MQALKEGYVVLSIIKMLLIGPPAVGKTSFKHLLFNWKPPHHHHSTAIADRPIRAVERIATLHGSKNWEEVTTEDLMQMLAEDIQAHAIFTESDTELSVSLQDIEKSTEVSGNEIETESISPDFEGKAIYNGKSTSFPGNFLMNPFTIKYRCPTEEG